MKTEIMKATDIARAAEIIRAGGTVAVPTETVYGIAADALNERAIARVFEAKGRDENKPISVFVTDMKMAEKFCRDIPDAAYKLAEKFFPGPLTIILKRGENVPDILTAGGDTVGVRCPDEPCVLELIRLCGTPLTGTSANLSGEPNLTSGAEVIAKLSGRVDAIIDAGETGGGVPSTVVRVEGGVLRVLREGGITLADLESAL